MSTSIASVSAKDLDLQALSCSMVTDCANSEKANKAVLSKMLKK